MANSSDSPSPREPYNEKQWHRDYYKANRERLLARAKKYYKDNREQCNARNRAYNELHQERMAESKAKWAILYRKSHREQLNAHESNHRSLLMNAEGKHSNSDIDRLYKLQRHQCAACKCRISNKSGPIKYHVDHVIALINGGSNWPSNLQLLCGPCNRHKHTMDDLKWANEHGRLFC